jgi:hypothetical protein
MSESLQGTASAAGAIAKVRYTHDAMIDMLIANPGIAQGALAKHFGFTQAWVSRIINSDAFQARLAERKKEIVDPSLVMSVDERLATLADRSLSILHEKLEMTQSPELAFKAAKLTIEALGYGARSQNVNLQQNFIVPMPSKAASDADWARAHQQQLPAPAAADTVIDVTAKNPDLARLSEGL